MGGRFLEGVLQGSDVNWANRCFPADEADCVLVALGLLHMRVKCLIPKELGGDYKPKVSAVDVVLLVKGDLLMAMCCPLGALVGHGQDVGRVICTPSVR